MAIVEDDPEDLWTSTHAPGASRKAPGEGGGDPGGDGTEVVGLDLGNVDIDEGAVWILGKGRSEKERLALPASAPSGLDE